MERLIKTRWLVLLLMPLLLVAGQGTSWADREDHEEALELLDAGKILPLEKIIEIVRNRMAGRITEVELEREQGVIIYELEVLDPSGSIWEVKVDAASGEVISLERE